MLSVHRAREWIYEACLCSHPPQVDIKAEAIRKELDLCLVTLMKQAANCDAVSTDRSSWYIDDANKIKRFITDTVRFANGMNHYPANTDDSNQLPSFWDANQLIVKRNQVLIERSEN
ncbi:hypothetical protein ACEV75_11160 [Vibrio parahaemolyticus]